MKVGVSMMFMMFFLSWIECMMFRFLSVMCGSFGFLMVCIDVLMCLSVVVISVFWGGFWLLIVKC